MVVMQKLLRSFYNRDTVLVAQELLGKHLVHLSNGVERIGRIVEVEAYIGQHDLASHSSKGKTERTKIMFGLPGYAYVYLVYGIHHCMNVVTEPGVMHPQYYCGRLNRSKISRDDAGGQVCSARRWILTDV